MDENKKQIETEYEPTPKEKNLLEVLTNPENRLKSITEICCIANCDRSSYYRAFEKPEFVAIYKQKSMELVKESVAPVINAAVREAKKGSYNHQKLILEMAGLYTEKQQVDANLSGEINVIKVKKPEGLE